MKSNFNDNDVKRACIECGYNNLIANIYVKPFGRHLMIIKKEKDGRWTWGNYFLNTDNELTVYEIKNLGDHLDYMDDIAMEIRNHEEYTKLFYELPPLILQPSLQRLFEETL